MNIATRKRLEEFKHMHPDAASSLDTWHEVVRSVRRMNFAQLRETYRSADYVDGWTIFNIKGNHYRLIAEVDYREQLVRLSHFLTHAEYSKGRWK